MKGGGVFEGEGRRETIAAGARKKNEVTVYQKKMSCQKTKSTVDRFTLCSYLIASTQSSWNVSVSPSKILFPEVLPFFWQEDILNYF